MWNLRRASAFAFIGGPAALGAYVTVDVPGRLGGESAPRDPFTAAHWNGRDVTLIIFPPPAGLPSVSELARGYFGRELPPGEWGELVGAPDGSIVHVMIGHANVDGQKDGVLIQVSHPWLEAAAVRLVYRDDQGRLAMFNAFLAVRPGVSPGVGTRLLALQVRKARSLGVEYLVMDAAGGPGSTFVGYRVWPRLGFDGSIPRAASLKLDGLPGDHPLRAARTVRDLLAQPGGRAWWDAHGSEFRAYFDLSEGSVSHRVLAAYTRERGIVV